MRVCNIVVCNKYLNFHEILGPKKEERACNWSTMDTAKLHDFCSPQNKSHEYGDKIERGADHWVMWHVSGSREMRAEF